MTEPYVFIVAADYRTGSIPTTLGASTSHGSRIVSISAIFGEGSCHPLNKTVLLDGRVF